MIKAQYGMFKWYEDLEHIHHHITENKNVLITFETNVIPKFQFMVDAGTTGTVTLVKEIGGAEITTDDVTITAESDYVRVHYSGDTLEEQADGWYYLRVDIGESSYYSDVFNWQSNLDGFIKLDVDSYDFALGSRQEYRYVTTNLNFVCYLELDQYSGVDLSNEEEANERDGQIIPYYSGFSRIRKYDIKGTEYIFNFLSGLRVLGVNGSIEITYRDEVFDAKDVSAEVTTQSGDFDIVIISLKFVSNNDIITPINVTR